MGGVTIRQYRQADRASVHRSGFHLLDARPTHIWSYVVDWPAENRCYGLSLT